MTTAINAENLDKRECVEQDDLLIGPLLAPRNSARQAGSGSIHDDATAQKLGFRGGTVAGSLHMEQLPPLLTHTFGDRWWQTGGMSLYFRYATTDQEAVRCFAKIDPSLKTVAKGQTNVWIEDNEEHLVAEGTASIGGADNQSALRMRIADVPRATDLRILKDVEIGESSSPQPIRISLNNLARRLEVITEPLEVYEGARPCLPPSLMVQTLRAGETDILVRHKDIGGVCSGPSKYSTSTGPFMLNMTILVSRLSLLSVKPRRRSMSGMRAC